MSDEPLRAERVFCQLKDFQRRTVNHVFRRMHHDSPPATRFLVADEVGLGKTLVAKGIVAKTIEHLRGRTKRIDVIYVCSNAAIAQQNVARLNVFNEKHLALSTRLTMLPTQLESLESHEVNFVSLTPGTTFDPKSRSGVMGERAVLYRILRDRVDVSRGGLFNLLQATAGRPSWQWWAEEWQTKIDPGLADRFTRRVSRDAKLSGHLREACASFERFGKRVPKNLPWEETDSRYSLISTLRRELSNVCIDALEPDLVILDEFQRFKDLLDGEHDAAVLARRLFSQEGARVLLLSATPYRMLALDHEEEDHYPDFIRTLEFLFEDRPGEVEALRSDLRDFRRGLYRTKGTEDDGLAGVRGAVEDRLKSVMVRTERVSSTSKRDAMVAETRILGEVREGDLAQAAMTDRIAGSLGSHDVIEYWKSSPYLLNFMKNYDLKRKLSDARDAPPEVLAGALRRGRKHLLTKDHFEGYAQVEPGNARLRALMAETLEAGQWELLWIPPTLPYLRPDPSSPYSRASDATKSLVFSSWIVVPDTISALCSYEAERRMLDGAPISRRYSNLHKTAQLLNFDTDASGNAARMSTLALLYPSVTLASAVDPLRFALADAGAPVAVDEALGRARDIIEGELRATGAWPTAPGGQPDRRWYWAALALLDARRAPKVGEWCRVGDGWRSVGAGHDPGSGFVRHVETFYEAFSGLEDLGRAPDDLVEVLAELALAGPAVCALRAMRRVVPGLGPDDPRMLDAAARVAGGFRTLFNLPETSGLLRAPDEDTSYWRRVLGHGLEGNVQAVLDEYAHTLHESLGLTDRSAREKVEGISEAMAEALSLRTSHVKAEEIKVREPSGRLEMEPISLRTRFALRFGEDIRDENDAVLARAGTVRQAFNSPFRPFILATTSVGQEGLDFHPYCHAVYHWNLPSNPVDMEQREGRVHRYKGHAVRKNVARAFGLADLREHWSGGDPWEVLFRRAAAGRPAGSNDLIPYWVYEEGGARVERRVPMLPFSREHGQLRRLKRSLGVYRLAFGQPRQEDLLAHLEKRLEKGELGDTVGEWSISLAPPEPDDRERHE